MCCFEADIYPAFTQCHSAQSGNFDNRNVLLVRQCATPLIEQAELHARLRACVLTDAHLDEEWSREDHRHFLRTRTQRSAALIKMQRNYPTVNNESTCVTSNVIGDPIPGLLHTSPVTANSLMQLDKLRGSETVPSPLFILDALRALLNVFEVELHEQCAGCFMTTQIKHADEAPARYSIHQPHSCDCEDGVSRKAVVALDQ